MYDQFRLPCYVCILALIAFYIVAYQQWASLYYPIGMGTATFKDMIDKETDVYEAIAIGQLQNIIISLGNTQKNVKSITSLFLFFVCFRII